MLIIVNHKILKRILLKVDDCSLEEGDCKS